MSYRPGFQYTNRRLGAPLAAIIPASIMSGLCGTLILLATVFAAAVASGEPAFKSIDELLSVLVAGGMAIALGSIAGAFVVAFYVLLFGFPVAAILGDRLRGPIGLALSMLTGLSSAVLVMLWMWGESDASGLVYEWELIFAVSAFALPAAHFYRRQVISMLDTYEA